MFGVVSIFARLVVGHVVRHQGFVWGSGLAQRPGLGDSTHPPSQWPRANCVQASLGWRCPIGGWKTMAPQHQHGQAVWLGVESFALGFELGVVSFVVVVAIASRCSLVSRLQSWIEMLVLHFSCTPGII